MDSTKALKALKLSGEPLSAQLTLVVDGIAPTTLVKALMDAVPGTLPSEAQSIARSRPVEVQFAGSEVRDVIAALERHGIEAEISFG